MQRVNQKGVGLEQDVFEQALVPVVSFQTVEHFWRVYDHLARPPQIQTSGQTTYHIFKHGIKPTWEDDNNSRGGSWIVRLRKGLAAHFWEQLLLALIGEQFELGDEICGAKLSIRFSEDIISLWNRNADNQEVTDKIRDMMRRFMGLPNFIQMEYKRHTQSITDKSSFRNATVWRTNSHEGDRGHGGGGKGYHKGKGGGGGGGGGGHNGVRGLGPRSQSDGSTGSDSGNRRWANPPRIGTDAGPRDGGKGSGRDMGGKWR